MADVAGGGLGRLTVKLRLGRVDLGCLTLQETGCLIEQDSARE